MFQNLFNKRKSVSGNDNSNLDKYSGTSEGLELAKILENQGNKARNNGDYLEAINFHSRSIKIYKKLGENENVKMLNQMLSAEYESNKDFDKAIDLELFLLKHITGKSKENMIRGKLKRLGDLYLSKGDLQTAENKYREEAFSFLESIYGDRPADLRNRIQIRLQEHFSERYLEIGKYQEAREQLELLLKINPNENIKYTKMIGDSFHQEGNRDQAILVYTSAYDNMYHKLKSQLDGLQDRSGPTGYSPADAYLNSIHELARLKAKQSLSELGLLADKLSDFYEDVNLLKSIEFAETADASLHSDKTKRRLEELKQKLHQNKSSNNNLEFSQGDLDKIKEELKKNQDKIQDLLRLLKNDLTTGRDVSLGSSSIDAAVELGHMGEIVIDSIIPYLETSSDAYNTLGIIGGDRAKQILIYKLKEADKVGNYRKVIAAIRGLAFIKDQEILDNLGWINDFCKDATARQEARTAIDHINKLNLNNEKTNKEVMCSVCGKELKYIPADVLLGEGWLGTGCPKCHQIYCDNCLH